MLFCQMRPTYPRVERRKKRDKKSSMSLYRMVACTLSLSVGPRLGFQCLAGWSVFMYGQLRIASRGARGTSILPGRRRGMDLGLDDRGMTPPTVSSPAAKNLWQRQSSVLIASGQSHQTCFSHPYRWIVSKFALNHSKDERQPVSVLNGYLLAL